MGRSTARELVRAAQAAELDKETDRAVALLEEAARLHLTSGEPGRAAALFRHCLRLAPGRTDFESARDAAERAAAPLELSEEPAAPAPVEVPAVARTLELPQRGPTAADPAIDCWCSFCCRPKAEVGPMVAGPAGAFICGSCIEGAAPLAGRRLGAGAEPAPASGLSGAPRDFVEAAVLLSRGLGWSLAEVRSLSVEERERALDLLSGLGPGSRR